MMNFKYYIYIVSDAHGNKEADVSSPDAIVYFCGMKDKSGESIFFEGDADHLSCWAAKYGLTCNIKEMSIDL
jgi:hypothetical protein